MKKICFVNGSPSAVNSSRLLLSALENLLPAGTPPPVTIHLQQRPDNQAAFAALQAADVIVIAFPLYYFAMPGLLIRFLEDFITHSRSAGGQCQAQVYGIINCGFPEPAHNIHAAKMLEHFCRRSGLYWRFALSIGAGPMIKGTSHVPLDSFMKRPVLHGLQAIAADLAEPPAASPPNLQVKVRFPSFLYRFMGNRGWLKMARENHLPTAELRRRPYQC